MGELDGGDWAIVSESLDMISNQGVWRPFGDASQIGVRGKIKDIWPGSGSSSPNHFVEVNGSLFFSANANLMHYRVLV